MSILNITELRMTFAWTETTPALLSGVVKGAPLAFLASASKYQDRWTEMMERLDAIVAGTTPAGPPTGGRELEPPWRWRNLGSRYSDHFWRYYLSNQDPLMAEPVTVWSRVTPFRENFRIPKTVLSGAAGSACRAVGHGLYYPHGYAAVITLYLSFAGGAGLELMMNNALNAAKGSFDLEGGKSGLDLEGVSAAILDTLRERALGSTVLQGERATNPLSTVTVVLGSGVNPDVAIVPGTLLHKALEGLCRWKHGWSDFTGLPDPEQTNLLVGPRRAGHVVHHSPRGRAVWMPEYFAAPDGREEHRLSCYHNNLVNVTLQTDMLARLVKLYMSARSGTKKPSASMKSMKALAQPACERLVDLYAAPATLGSKPTYNSASPRFYLQENGFLDLLKEACKSFEPPVPEPAYTPR